MYSNIILQETRNVRNVYIKKVNLRFNPNTVRMIKLLEVLQEYSNIEDLNTNNFINFIEESVKYYEEKTMERVIKSISYKKSTLASLKNILDFFNLENKIDKHLRGTSKYDEINMEELYDSAS